MFHMIIALVCALGIALGVAWWLSNNMSLGPLYNMGVGHILPYGNVFVPPSSPRQTPITCGYKPITFAYMYTKYPTVYTRKNTNIFYISLLKCSDFLWVYLG